MKSFKPAWLFLLVLLVFSCEEKETNTETNHTVEIYHIRGTAQFTRIVLTLIENSNMQLEYTFVSNPDTRINVKVKLPKTATYRLDIYTPDNKKIFWNNVAMDANNGISKIELDTKGGAVYCPGSTLASFIPPDGCDL